MTAQRPTFRITRNGYDRFAVDDAIERYASEVDQLQKKIELYQEQLVDTTRRLDEMKEKYEAWAKDESARREANENIARLSLREANEIIATAQKNADDIVREALTTARVIVSDLHTLYDQADEMKGQMNRQLEGLMNQLDGFELPRMPDVSWLKDAEKKLQ